jgi:hypothetical protein
MSRERRVYRLVIMYPEGSDAPGWRPACWSDPGYLARLSRKSRRKLTRHKFAWPRERVFLSSSSAYERAWVLRAYGAEVLVEASLPVQWPETVFTADTETYQASQDWPEFDASGIPLLEPVS